MSEMQNSTAAHTPTVYFIDDSATMREVIKIAFRKESIQVVTCPDAATALAQFATVPPDAVITDVIMPDKDGYEVCQLIKQNEALAKTPVILMSGIVNRTVAEKAMAVKADELVRKPFQPADLIARVKSLLNPKGSNAGNVAAQDASASEASRVLGGLFGPPAAATPPTPAQGFRSDPFHATPPPTPMARPAAPPTFAAPGPQNVARPVAPAAIPPASPEVLKLKNEIRRLELLVKKLQAELEAQRQYSSALEADFKVMQES
ncbi:MAG: response regulator [Candidatus Acidiferrales bacterium]